MFCNEGYEFFNNSCIENEGIKIMAYKEIERITEGAKKRLGNYKCKLADTQGLTYEQIIIYVNEKHTT